MHSRGDYLLLLCKVAGIPVGDIAFIQRHHRWRSRPVLDEHAATAAQLMPQGG